MRTKAKNTNEKMNLEIIEKKIDIRKKRLEMRNEKISSDNFEPRRIVVDEDHALVSKIQELRMLLTVSSIDEDRTVFGSDPVYKNILNLEEKEIVKSKLIELINKF